MPHPPAGSHRYGGWQRSQPRCRSGSPATEPSDPGAKLDHTRNIYIEPERQLAWEAPAAPAQARPRTSGSRLALYHVHVNANTAGLHALVAMGLNGRLLFDNSNRGRC
jgi:hypothetical protein